MKHKDLQHPKWNHCHAAFQFISCFVAIRLESQMTADIQAILQLLQRQTAAGPPAYSTVTSSPEYQRPAVRIQLVSPIDVSPAPSQPQVQQKLNEWKR